MKLTLPALLLLAACAHRSIGSRSLLVSGDRPWCIEGEAGTYYCGYWTRSDCLYNDANYPTIGAGMHCVENLSAANKTPPGSTSSPSSASAR